MVEKTVTPTALEIMGRNHAVDMLVELKKWWNELDLGDVVDDGIGEATLAQEPRILRKFLEVARRDPEAERGFYSKLSVFIASAVAEWPDEIIENNREDVPE